MTNFTVFFKFKRLGKTVSQTFSVSADDVAGAKKLAKKLFKERFPLETSSAKIELVTSRGE